ncbi:MAG: hypothetical protein ACH37Z_02300 [Anaerolineae bacterium]
MTLPLDDRSTRRLTIVRQLFLTAEVAARDRGNPVAGMIAIVGFDLAAESLLKALLASASPGHSYDITFPDLLKKCDVLLTQQGLPALSVGPRLYHLHKVRNGVQHDARVPHVQEVDDARLYVHGFCQSFVRDVWGADFESMSLIELVRDNLTRRVLHRAQEDIAAGNLLRGLALANHAFLCTCEFPFLDSLFSGGYLSSRVNGMTPELRREVTNGLKAARDDAVSVSSMMAATTSIGDLSRLLTMVPWVDSGSSGNQDQITYSAKLGWKDTAPDESAARWALNFVVDSIVSWQQQGLSAVIAKHKDHVHLAELLINWDEQKYSMTFDRRPSP